MIPSKIGKSRGEYALARKKIKGTLDFGCVQTGICIGQLGKEHSMKLDIKSQIMEEKGLEI